MYTVIPYLLLTYKYKVDKTPREKEERVRRGGVVPLAGNGDEAVGGETR